MTGEKASITWKIVAGAMGTIILLGFAGWMKWVSEVALEAGDKSTWMRKMQAQIDKNTQSRIAHHGQHDHE